MKKMILALATLATLALPFAALAEQTTTYQRKAVVRFFGTKQFCDESQGEYDADPEDAGRGACYITQEDGNKIQITGDQLHVETLFGAAHERAFDGQIVSASATRILARETETSADGNSTQFAKDGCVMTVVIKGDLASTEPGENCDSGLTLNDAKLVN